MDTSFEELISSFIESNVGITDCFINEILSAHLINNIQKLNEQHLLFAARTGNKESSVPDKTIRSDSIYWLDRKHKNIHEDNFLDRIDAFVTYLNKYCYTGIKDYEFHYTVYEPGSFYTKHIDQFQNNSKRAYSFICYLNAGWLNSDGGQLLIHQSGLENKIEPENRKAIFFKSSEIEHEVLMTHKRRLSITGWFRT